MNKPKDVLKPLKIKGYARAFGDPGKAELTYDSLLNFAKAYLCRKTKTLMKDPIWDAYTNEEIIIEYFSHLFTDNEKMREEFESDLIDRKSDYDWIVAQEEQNKKELQAMSDELEDSLDFSPEVLGE